MRIHALVFALSLGLTASAFGANRTYLGKYVEKNDGSRELLFQGWISAREGEETGERSYPQLILEHEPLTTGKIIELTGAPTRVKRLLRQRNVIVTQAATDSAQDDEVTTLIDNGPPANRIDLVFMGDGYLESEKEKFLEDVRRLTKDMFEGPTFHSYLPLFNVHAVFRASRESGIGKDSRPKDTAFGLYRIGNTLRAIVPSKARAAEDACHKAPDCDYGILMANDPYYGGSGGEFAVTTSSPTSGTIVLRHELGHIFGEIGEEYDGGGYFGANHSSSRERLPWSHWLTGDGEPESALARFVGWPWHNLAEGPFKARFDSDGKSAATLIEYSASGMERDEDLKIELDGKAIPFKSPGHADRTYHRFESREGFSSGKHELVFEQGPGEGNRMFSSLTIYEFGEKYHFADDYVGAFPVFGQWGGSEGYRPTHEGCLMRKMTTSRFCPVCQENNWLHFFAKVTLVDKVKVTHQGGEVSVSVVTPALGQLRREPAKGETLKIAWFRDGQEVSELAGQKEWSRSEEQVKGDWRVEVQLVTPEVRKDPDHRLSGKKSFSI